MCLSLYLTWNNCLDVLAVEIIRRVQADSGVYSYGCRFVALHPLQESMVRECVFRQNLQGT